MRLIEDMCLMNDAKYQEGSTNLTNIMYPVADSGGVRGVQMHPPLAASNVFLRT